MNYEEVNEAYNAPVSQISVDRRGQFISKTYNHLLGAIVGFILIELALFESGMAQKIATFMLSMNWLIILGAFMLVSWLASRFAHNAQSKATQYSALAGFVLAEAIIFVPMLYIANAYAPGAITSAATLTLLGFAGLTGIAFFTKKDFSFLKGVLMWGGVLALVGIVGGVIFGYNMGTWFSLGMVAFAGAAILYDTSNIIHHYPEDKYVAAALELFASVALMFWYLLRFFMSRD